MTTFVERPTRPPARRRPTLRELIRYAMRDRLRVAGFVVGIAIFVYIVAINRDHRVAIPGILAIVVIDLSTRAIARTRRPGGMTGGLGWGRWLARLVGVLVGILTLVIGQVLFQAALGQAGTLGYALLAFVGFVVGRLATGLIRTLR